MLVTEWGLDAEPARTQGLVGASKRKMALCVSKRNRPSFRGLVGIVALVCLAEHLVFGIV